MAGGEVVVCAADLLFELTYFLRKEFYGAAAFGADHVVMTAAIVLMFVAGDAVVEGNDARKTALGKQFERAVDRGVTDAGVFLLNEAVQFVGGEVIAGLQEGAENRVALASLFQADILEMAMEDVLSFANHLAGDGGLIVDTFLQHWRAG